LPENKSENKDKIIIKINSEYSKKEIKKKIKEIRN